MKQITDKQQDLIDSMEDYGCESYDSWLHDHPTYKYKCSYTASQYIEEFYEFFLEQKKFMS